MYWYEKSAGQGFLDAICNKAYLLYIYSKNQEDYKVAFETFKRAADAGHMRAQNYVGDCYYNGHGVAKNFKTALDWYKKSAIQGFHWGQYNLARCCEEVGVLKEAYDLFLLAAKQGNERAKEKIEEYRRKGWPPSE